jgi:hypothetical protein
MRTQHVDIAGLEPGRRLPLRLWAGEASVAEATATTLPDRLPGIGEQPFTCLLGSCFGRDTDSGGAVGAAFLQLPAAYRPVLTLLCGDQVYLDAPFPRYLFHAPGGDDLRSELLATYLRTWTQSSDGRGYANVLRHGATFFSADDHELWNNAPNKTPTVRKTWFGSGRQELFDISSDLYDRFQASARTATFDIGRLSFFVADSRLDRSADRKRIQDPADHAAVLRWIGGLSGPGILVLGQPVLTTPSGWKGHVTDWDLPDYEQYAPLVRAIQQSAHDIVVLTGDVHFGRIAGTTSPTGVNLYEVIASPLALVDSRLGRDWGPPPGRFPAEPLPGTIGTPVWFDNGYQETRDHFATVAFQEVGDRVEIAVTAWPIPPLGMPPTQGATWQAFLH